MTCRLACLLLAVAGSTSAQPWPHTEDIVITHPPNGTTFNTGQAVLVQWQFNPQATNLDFFRLDLMSGDRVLTLPISSTVTTSTGQYLYTFPGSLTSGQYWFAASTGLTLRGYGPFPNGGSFGGSFVNVVAGASCNNHNECAGDEYCDRNNLCVICDECHRWFDGIDFDCPNKGGACQALPPFVPGSAIPGPPVTEAEASGVLDDFLEPGCPEYNRLVINTDQLMTFAPSNALGEPARMSTRLRDKLVQLVRTLQGDVRFNGLRLRCQQAYLLPPTSAGVVPSLYYAGRAAEITITVGTSTNVSTNPEHYELVGRVAAFEGIDFVEYTTATTIHLSVIPDGCRTPLDLALLLDGSGSIEMPQYGGSPGNFVTRILGFAKALIPHFQYGPHPNQTRMSITTFASSSNTRVNFFLDDYDTAPELLAAIDNIPYPRGGTATSVGINTVRTSVFTEANGMRPAALGIPRVTIAITDGQSNNGFAPGPEATLLKGDPVNSMMISIGVGFRYSASELIDMASEPVQQNVYTLKSFEFLAAIVDKISFSACQSRPIIDSGVDTNGVVGQCQFLFFRSQCGHLQESVIEVTSTSGLVNVYVDNSTSPGPFRNLFSDETTSLVKTIVVTRAPGETSPMFIGIKGVGTGTNSFSVRVFSNFFTGSSNVTAQIPETATSGDLVFTPQFTPGATYTILGGNEGNPPPFSIQSSTGVITVNQNAVLDFETRSSYDLRVSAVNNVLQCQNGLMFVHVDITDVNDVVPAFVGAPYSASVALNTPANTPVPGLTIRAVDSDGGPLVYGLTVTRRRDRRQTADFSIDQSTGVISTANTIDGSTTSYQLSITATDGTFTGTASATITVDPCDTCPAGTFVSQPCSGGTTTVVCQPITGCGPGTFLSSEATASSNRVCLQCPPGEFQSSRRNPHSSTSCTPFSSQCPPGLTQVGPGSATSDIQCAAQPTVAPTEQPTTLQPTPPPTAPTVPPPTDSDTSQQSSGDDSAAAIVWWPALLVLLLLLVLLAGMVLRSRQKVDDKDVSTTMASGNPLYGEFQIGTPTSSRAALMTTPLTSLATSGNPLWCAFRRCIAFDTMYYGNPPLRLDDEALCEVYTVLQLAAPDTGTLGKLRTIGDRFLASRFESSVNNDLLHDDVNDFYWSAIADEMVERAIDALARRHEYDESTGHVKPVYDVGASQEDFFDQCLSDLTEDYVPSENRFLMPVKSNPALRQLPPTMNPEGEAVYEMAGTKAHAEIEYALAAGAAPEAGAAVSYDMANQPTAHEYAVSCGADDIVGVSQGEEVYTMASGVGSADVTYDIGGIGSAMTDTDVVYDMGGAQQRPHGGDAIYDNKARGRPVSEAVYDLGGAGGSSTVDSFKKRPAGRPASEAVYDLGGGGSSSVDDDGAIYDNSPELLESDVVEANAVYDIGSGGEGYLGLGGASTDDAPAQYDVGSSDAMDATYDVGNCATEEDVAVDVTSLEAPTDSEGYLTMSREEPVLVPEVYAKGPTYDLGTAPIAPIATYELADDMEGDDRPHSRTRSYDNALNDAAA